MKKGELKQHEPDQLDHWCDLIFSVLAGIPKGEREAVLEQCLDYLRNDA